MRWLQNIISIILVLSAFNVKSLANEAVWTPSGYDMNWISGDLEITDSQWSTISILRTHNEVTVRMYEGTGANQFFMYDNSSLTTYYGSINYLYLYDNATASLFGSSYMNEIYMDPANTGWVKFYAEFDRFEPYGPNGKGTVYGNWLSEGNPFSIYLSSDGAYSKVQFIPEPASALIFALGAGWIASRRQRR